jgi:hypothetical protein
MSTLKTNNVQVGQSVTATNNFTLYQPSSPDGTVRLGVGNSGATTLDVITATSAGAVTLAGALSGTTGSFSGNMSFNSGYGSAAVAYGCRAWVNFNGTGTVAIRGSGNVSSITDNGTGDYTVNFATAMPDVNYSVIPTRPCHNLNDLNRFTMIAADPDGNAAPYILVGSVRLRSGYDSNLSDGLYQLVAIFR